MNVAGTGRHAEVLLVQYVFGASKLSEQDRRGRAPLHVANDKGHTTTLRLLCDPGGLPRSSRSCRKSSGWDGTVPMTYTAARGHKEAVVALFTSGASIPSAPRP